MWWNPAVERQAIDRVHRTGSPHAANYFFKFYAEGTDEAGVVMEKQIAKHGLYDETTERATEAV